MKLKSYIRKAKKVVVKWTDHGNQGDEVKSVESPQAPLDEMETALQSLRDVISSIMELPLRWMETVQVRSISVSYTSKGTRSVQIGYTKALRCGKVESCKTPLFQIDPPDESEDEPRACTIEEAIEIVSAITAAEAYIQGERKDSDCEAITHIFEDPNQVKLGLDEGDEDPEA